MISFVTAAGLGKPLRHLLPQLRQPARRWTYERLARRRRVPMGTWIFTDHERLSAFELNVAADVASQLRRAGCRVLNHPATVRSRMNLLEALHAAGINAFRAYRADEQPKPHRFPVFIRREFDHRGDARTLIGSQPELDAVLAALRAEGVPLQGRLVIEYAASEAAPGIWYRGSAYCVGGTVIPHHMALDDHWQVKDGFGKDALETSARRDHFIAAERDFVMEGGHVDLLRRVFDIAGIDYGRADFGFLGDRLQVYEINTNPTHGHPARVFGNIHPEREATLRFSEQRLHEALDAIDTPGSGSVALAGPLLAEQRNLFPLLPAGLRRP